MICDIVNETHNQTRLQRSMEKNLGRLMQLYKHDHPEAVLQFENLQKLHTEIQLCCPPRVPNPPCEYLPCDEPEKLEKPPEKENKGPK